MNGAAATAQKNSQRYSRLAMWLHWALALGFAFEIGLGWRMDAPRSAQTFAVYQLHKSVGIAILILTIARLGWRLANPAPPYPSNLRRAERLAATLVHAGFYVLLIGLPLTGWLLVSSSATAIPTILFGILPWPHVPGMAGLAALTKARFNDAATSGHIILGYVAYLLIAGHVAGALKHQFVDRADDLGRMLPLRPNRLGLGLIVVLGLFALAALLGRAVRLHPIGSPSVVLVAPPRPAARQSTRVTTPVPPPAKREAAPAAAPAAHGEDLAAKPPVAWQVRPAASAIRFHTAWSGGPVDGRFDNWKGYIRFSPEALDKSSVRIMVDLASVQTGVAETQTALPGADWFAADQHPQATFIASRFSHLAGGRYQAFGTLTLRGIAQPVTLRFTLRIAGSVAMVDGTTTIDRLAFGIGQGDWSATTDLPANVTVSFSLEADRQSANSKGE